MAAADVAFVESAQSALVALLTGWRLPTGSRVACLPGEYAPNIAQLRTYGLRPEPLPVDGLGRAEVEGVERQLAADPPSFVHLTHIPSHRGLLQPAAEIAALCRAAGVPLVLDAAQSLGHTDVDLGADAVYGTSRKWLAGPRGVGGGAAAGPPGWGSGCRRRLRPVPQVAGRSRGCRDAVRAAGPGRPVDAGAARAGGGPADAGLRVRRGARRGPGGARGGGR